MRDDLISRQAVIEAIDVLSKSPYATQIQFGMERREVMNKVKKLCVENLPTVAVMEVMLMHCDDLKASECCQVQATKIIDEEAGKMPQEHTQDEYQVLYNQLMETEKDAEKEFERLNEEIRVLKEIELSGGVPNHDYDE